MRLELYSVLESVAEVWKCFPYADINQIKEFDYKTDEMWHGNIIHNMTEMANRVSLGELTLYNDLWRSEKYGCKNASTNYLPTSIPNLNQFYRKRTWLLSMGMLFVFDQLVEHKSLSSKRLTKVGNSILFQNTASKARD